MPLVSKMVPLIWPQFDDIAAEKKKSTIILIYTNQSLMNGLKEDIISLYSGLHKWSLKYEFQFCVLHFKGGNKSRFQEFPEWWKPFKSFIQGRNEKLGMFGIQVKFRGIIKAILNIKSADLKSIEQSYSSVSRGQNFWKSCEILFTCIHYVEISHL